MTIKHGLIVFFSVVLSACSTPPVSYSNDSNSNLVVIIHGLTKSGLLIRYHLQADNALQQQGKLGHVVLVGTPNHGSEVADQYTERFWANWFGEVPNALVTSEDGFAQSLNPPTYDFGVIAGTKTFAMTDALFHKPNDGLVSVESTKLQNMHGFIELEINHMRLRDDPETIHQVVHYLDHGKFDHPKHN